MGAGMALAAGSFSAVAPAFALGALCLAKLDCALASWIAVATSAHQAP